MATRILFIFLIMGLSLLGCRSTETLFTVRSDVDMTIPAGANTIEILGLDKQVVFPYEQNLNIFSVSEADVERLIAQKAFAFSKFNADLDLIEVIEINVVNQDDPTDQREVFYFDPVPFGSKTEIQLFPSLPDIKRFVKDDTVLFKVELTFRRIPTQNIDIRIEMEFGAVGQ